MAVAGEAALVYSRIGIDGLWSEYFTWRPHASNLLDVLPEGIRE